MKKYSNVLFQSAALLNEHPEFEAPNSLAPPPVTRASEKDDVRHAPGEQEKHITKQKVARQHSRAQFRSEEEILATFLMRKKVPYCEFQSIFDGHATLG